MNNSPYTHPISSGSGQTVGAFVNKKDIIDIICLEYGIARFEFFSKRRIKPLPEARGMASFIFRKLKGLSYYEIRDEVRIDHCTVIYWENKLSNEINIYPDTSARVDRILKILEVNKTAKDLL